MIKTGQGMKKARLAGRYQILGVKLDRMRHCRSNGADKKQQGKKSFHSPQSDGEYPRFQAGTGAANPPVGKSGSIGLLDSAAGVSVGGGGSGGGFCAITGGLRM